MSLLHIRPESEAWSTTYQLELILENRASVLMIPLLSIVADYDPISDDSLMRISDAPLLTLGQDEYILPLMSKLLQSVSNALCILVLLSGVEVSIAVVEGSD